MSLQNTLVQKSWGARQSLQVLKYSASGDKQQWKKLDFAHIILGGYLVDTICSAKML